MELVSFPAQALLILEERLREQAESGVQMPSMPRTELALKILVVTAYLDGKTQGG